MKMRLITILLLSILIISSACNQDDNQFEQIPRVPTDVQINLNLPEFSPLNNPGSWVYTIGGSKGIVIYRIGPDDFGVFDRHCPYQVPNGCVVHVDPETNITAADTACCGSVYNLFDGSPVSGPAVRPLEPFQYTFNSNANTLRIFN
jgi:hypothetical protein